MKNIDKANKKNTNEYGRHNNEVDDIQLIADEDASLTTDEDASLTTDEDASLTTDEDDSITVNEDAPLTIDEDDSFTVNEDAPLVANEKSVPKNKVIASFKHDHKPIRFRFFAAVIDWFVVWGLALMSGLLFGAPDWFKYMQMGTEVNNLAATDPLALEFMRFHQQCYILTLLIGWVYDSLMMIFFKASLGKLVFGLHVVDYKKGRRVLISKLFLILRAFIKGFSIYVMLLPIPYFIMCLTAFGNDEHRSGFDMFSGTKVIDVRRHKK